MEILTAIGKPTLKKALENNNYKVYLYDLQYQEAVIDVLTRNKKIKILFLNSLLPGEFSIYEFINKIIKINSKIKIIIILEKENEEIKNFLNSKNIFDIYYNNKIKINELINCINKDEKINIKKNKIKDKIIKNINKNIFELKNIIKKRNIKNEKNKIINIIGNYGSRKNNFFNNFILFIKRRKNINYRFR